MGKDKCDVLSVAHQHKTIILEVSESKIVIMKEINPSLESLALSIRNKRQKLNISQENLAKKCNFSTRYIELLETAQIDPSFLHLDRICKALNISLADLTKNI